MTIELKSFPRSENKEHFFTVYSLFFAVLQFCFAKYITVKDKESRLNCANAKCVRRGAVKTSTIRNDFKTSPKGKGFGYPKNRAVIVSVGA